MYKKLLIIVCFLLIISGNAIAQENDRVRIIFMHHSTGYGVMTDGEVREILTALGYEFWDHDYNDIGLRDPNGNETGINWDVPDDNTDIDGWYNIFNQPVTDPPSNTLSHMLEYDVIIFKSCFPNSAIADDDMLDSYREYYLGIRDVIDNYPEKIFITWTTPPLVPNETDAEQAIRARLWAEYLTSDEFLDGHPNLYVFDFFNLMADDEGFLRQEFRTDEWDSHPNEIGNRFAGDFLADYIFHVIDSFVLGEAIPRPVLDIPDADNYVVSEHNDEEPSEGDSSEPQNVEVLAAGDMIDDFEDGDCASDWWTYSDEGAEITRFEVSESGYNSDYAMLFSFDVPPEHYINIGKDFGHLMNWESTSAISFFWHSEQEGMEVRFVIFAGNMDDPTPFEIKLQTPKQDWTQVIIYWEDLSKVQWVGDAGLAEFDPTRIIGIGFDIGSWEENQQNTIWLDDLQLMD